ncbi:GAF domain-containing protein [Pararoseomonas indoligenes]|uniref:GAF domain-containing protein n=1 Tax=Roseomonas indoligenes TaxID=2820811 RepID=A0A940N1A2_9PROT|nr:GAF domain-containing protein [Pararoseomonas indoligenes]MBP0496086.1 GAF domain-containing protein [Pararoseomonas indoligenes]
MSNRDREEQDIPSPGSGVAKYGAISVRIETLSPDQAASILSRRAAEARLNASAVEMYRLAMLDGRWIFNGAPIIFSRSGVLLDGVQRIAACIAADIPLTTAVARDVDDEVLPTIDQRRRRAFAAVLSARGVANARAQASLTERLIRYDDGTLLAGPEATPDWGRMESALRSNPGIGAAVADSLAMTGSPLPEPVRSAILYMGRQVDPALTMRLLETLRHPERFDSSEPGTVLRAEIDRLHDDSLSPPNRTRLLALSIEALNALLRHERPRRIVWHGATGGPESFPQLDGYPGLALSQGASASAPLVASSPLPVGVTLKFETIDARDAARYLQTKRKGVAASRNDVDAIARDIADGRWQVNAQPICFSMSGRLLDGSRRLMAVVATKAAIPVLVVRGLAEEAGDTFDHHTPRPPAVRHTLGSFGDAALAAAMANLLWRHEHRNATVKAKKATPAEVQRILDQHPRLLALRGFGRRMIDYGRASVMGYAAYTIERDDPTKAAPFLRAIETGANLAEGHPVLALRDTMKQLRHERATQDSQYEAMMEGWNRFKAYQTGIPAPEHPPVPTALQRAAWREVAPSGRASFRPAASLTSGRIRHVNANPAASPGRALQQQAALAAFSRFALRSKEPSAVIQEAARVAAEGTGTPFSRILRYEAATGTLLLHEGRGWRPESVGRMHFHLDPRFPASQAFMGDRPALHPRRQNRPKATLPLFMQEHGVRRSLDVAIPGGGAHYGVLGVDDTAEGDFTPGDVAFLEVVANILGLSIEAARRAQKP